MKRLGYYLFNIVYYIFYLIPTNKNKILLIMTHDKSPEGNVLYAANYFKSKTPELFFKKVTKESYNFRINKKLFKKLINFFIFIPYHAATSKVILLDNIFLPFAYTKFKKKVAIVQLWHGTGTIKRFALDTEVGLVEKLATKACSKYTHLIIGSEEMIPIYKSAFKMEQDKIFPIGSPRTDLFFDKDYIKKKKEKFYNSYPELLNKKIILYAPTFRDEDFKKKYLENNKLKFNLDDNLDLNLDIFNILKYLGDEYVLLLSLHPSLTKNFSIANLNLHNKMRKRIYDFSNFNCINSLMFISDYLITDYSSIIFEYSLLNKPMICYPYDLDEFKNYSRGFYFNYPNFVPGKVVFNVKDISKELRDNYFNNEKIENFKNSYMVECDGNSTKRLFNLIYY